MSNLILFTIEGCIHCDVLKKKLKDEKIEYINVDVYENERLWDDVVKQTGHDLTPTVFIKKDEFGSGPVLIPGIDFNSEDEALILIKQNL